MHIGPDEAERALAGLEEPFTGAAGTVAAPDSDIVRPMVLSLIQSSYLRTRTLTEFARDVFDIVGTAVSVPAAFAEGFLRSFFSIQSVTEDEGGCVVITPKPGAREEDVFREVDEITARIEPGAVYNPVVRRQMNMVAEATNMVLQQDLEAMAELTPAEFASVLEDLEETGRPVRLDSAAEPTQAEIVRRRLHRVREALRAYQAELRAGSDAPPQRS